MSNKEELQSLRWHAQQLFQPIVLIHAVSTFSTLSKLLGVVVFGCTINLSVFCRDGHFRLYGKCREQAAEKDV